jgi:hypothetical protein
VDTDAGDAEPKQFRRAAFGENMNAEHYECSLKEYHEDTSAFSHSQAEDLIASPPLFHGRHLIHPPIYPKKKSDEFDVGTICHEALTNPNGLGAVVLEIPDKVLNCEGHRKGAAWKEWDESHPNIIKMKRDELEPVYRMVESVQETVPQWMWNSRREYEFNIRWVDSETGLGLRCRPDWIIYRNDKLIILDFKTTRSWTPRTFSSDITKFGFHRQAAWYIDGVLDYFQEDVESFLFIPVDKTPAHETRIYELHPEAIKLGRLENRKALTELAYRLDSNNWNSRDKGEIKILDLPDWKYKSDPWSTEA